MRKGVKAKVHNKDEKKIVAGGGTKNAPPSYLKNFQDKILK